MMILVCFGLVLVAGLAVSRFVWLPDVITGRVIVLSKISNAAGDNMRLVQFFNGDGYLTEFIHTDNSGHRWSVVIDPDAKKAWLSSLSIGSSNSVTIGIWDHTINYDIKSHMVTGLRSQPLAAYEIPRGTPIVPAR